MPATCKLVGLYPEAHQLPKPDSGHSYVVYDVSGFEGDAAIHGFIRLVEAAGPAMGKSKIPMETSAKLGLVIAEVVRALDDGKIDAFDLGQILGRLKGL